MEQKKFNFVEIISNKCTTVRIIHGVGVETNRAYTSDVLPDLGFVGKNRNGHGIYATAYDRHLIGFPGLDYFDYEIVRVTFEEYRGDDALPFRTFSVLLLYKEVSA